MEEELTLDLKSIFEILRKRIKIIVSITLIATIISGIFSFFIIKPTYEATLSVFIGKSSSAKKNAIEYNQSDIMMYQKLVKTYAKFANSNDVMEKAAKELGGEYTAKKLQTLIKVAPQADTQIMDIKVESKNSKEAKKIAETVTKYFIAKAEKMIPNGNVQVMDKAKVPEDPVKPRKMLNVAIAFFLGAMVSLGVVFVLEYMDNTIKTEDDIKRYVEIPVLGMIPEHKSE